MRLAAAFMMLCAITSPLAGQDRAPVAQTPPMGWNSWDSFGPTVTEQEVKMNADYMAAHLKQFGWEYVIVDIRWYVENDKAHGYNERDALYSMDEYGRFLPAVNKFPSASGGRGFRPLADYIHAKGLKFGIHLMRGIPKAAVEKNTNVLGSKQKAKDIFNTDRLCTWLGDMYSVDPAKPGAQEYYNSLFDLYASWNVDFVKIDDLSRPYHKEELEMIRTAIEHCGRPMVLSTSPGETPITEAAHVMTHAAMWRIIDDFWDNWAQLAEHFSLFEKWIPFAGPGHWPDGDMLPLGKIGIRAERGDPRMTLFTHDEQMTLMSLFAICRSPLMFGGNLPDNDAFTLSLLTNDEIINILRGSTHNRLLYHEGGNIAWAADDAGSGDRYVALFYPADDAPILEHNARGSSTRLTYKPGEQSATMSVDIAGAKKLFLVVTNGGDDNNWDHADWIEPALTGKSGRMKLTQLKWTRASAGWGSATVGRSVGGNPLVVDGKSYTDGIGTHANSIIEYELPEGYDTFTSTVGLDKECVTHPEGATVRFHVFTEYPTGAMPADSAMMTVKFDQIGLTGAHRVRDLWEHRELGVFTDAVTVSVRKHGVSVLKIRK